MNFSPWGLDIPNLTDFCRLARICERASVQVFLCNAQGDTSDAQLVPFAQPLEADAQADEF